MVDDGEAFSEIVERGIPFEHNEVAFRKPDM